MPENLFFGSLPLEREDTLINGRRCTADGAFTLLTFQHKPPLPLMTTTSARLAAALLLPFSLTSSHTLGTLGGAFHLTLTSRASLANLVVRIPLADGVEGAGQVQASVSGGALLRDEEGRSIGGGAGRYEVVEEEEEVSATATVSEGPARRRRRLVLVWQIEKLAPTDRPAVLSGQYNITCVYQSLGGSGTGPSILPGHHILIRIWSDERTASRTRASRLLSPSRSTALRRASPASELTRSKS